MFQSIRIKTNPPEIINKLTYTIKYVDDNTTSELSFIQYKQSGVNKEYDSYDGWYMRERSYDDYILCLDDVEIDQLNGEWIEEISSFKLITFDDNKIKYEFENKGWVMNTKWHYLNVREYNIITKELKTIKHKSLI